MKKQLLLGVAIFGAGAAVNSSAFAASPVYNWTGCYVGANAGYGWGHASADTNADSLASLGLPTASSTSLKPKGFVGGGQAGCNWQYNVAVFGFEQISKVRPRRPAVSPACLSIFLRAPQAMPHNTSKQGFGGSAPFRAHAPAYWSFQPCCSTEQAVSPTATSR